MNEVEEYVQQILSGELPACHWEKKAVQRYVDDFKREDIYFDKEEAVRVMEFIEMLQHTKGVWSGSTIKLEPFQKFLVVNLFGWKYVESDFRRYRNAYISMARKNAKTTLAAALGVYMAFADGEGGSEVFCIATKRDQAKIAWEIARSMVRKDPALREVVNAYHSSLEYDGSVFKPLSSDDKSEDGHSPHFAIIDEYHQHQTAGMLDAMLSGMGSRMQPMTLIITTAGVDKSVPCFEEEEYAKDILNGIKTNDEYFAMIYTLDDDDDYADEKVWRKANPNLDVSLTRKYLESRVALALSSPSKTNDVLTKNFNIWTTAKSRWLNYIKWQANNTKFEWSELEGKTAYGGLDLSTSIDLTAFALNFPPTKTGEKHRKLYRFFLPEDGIDDKERQDKVPYRRWAEQGYLILTPGEVIDYSWIETEIKKLGKIYTIKEIAFDPYNALNIVSNLSDEGFDMVQYRQGFVTMNLAVRNYERLVVSNLMETNDNPIMNWMISNAEIITDSNGNMKIDKPKRGKSTKRIDGVIADLMATDRSLAHGDIYQEKEYDFDKMVRFVEFNR